MQDEAAFARYETEMVETYERRFGKPARIAHDVLRQLGMRDRDLDVFYAHPANAFQMRIVGDEARRAERPSARLPE